MRLAALALIAWCLAAASVSTYNHTHPPPIGTPDTATTRIQP